MKISFLNLEHNPTVKIEYEKNLKFYQRYSLVSFLFFLFYIIITFIIINIAFESFNQKKISKKFFSSLRKKNLYYSNEDLPNIKLRNLEGEEQKEGDKEEKTHEETEEEKREREKQESRQKIATNASKIAYTYFVFLFKTVYSMLKIRAYTQEELEKNVKNQVWFYLYVSNNGYLIFSGFLILYYKFTYDEFQKGYYLLYASGALFVIGTIAIISFIISTCKADEKFFDIFYSYDLVKPLYKMPFASVRNFLLLEDKCCSCNKNKNPNEIPKCVCCCSTTTLIAKYFTLIITAIVYYGSLLFLTIILLIVISCFKIKGQKQDMNPEKENDTKESLFSKTDDNEQNLIKNENENVAENNNNNQEMNINNEENNFQN